MFYVCKKIKFKKCLDEKKNKYWLDIMNNR